MSYFKLRLTPSKYDDPTFNWTFGKFIPEFRKYLGVTKFTWGCEQTDSCGKPTLPHIHIHGMYDIDKNGDTLKKHLRTFSKKYGYEFAGNKCYSVTLLGDVDDEDRFMRYPLKKEDFTEIEEKRKGGALGISPKTLEMYRLLARDEYKSQKEKNLKSLANYLDKSSFKGKMYDKFNKDGISVHKDFCINLLKHYQSKNKVPPFGKIDDYWVDYQIMTGLMTPEQWYEITYKL